MYLFSGSSTASTASQVTSTTLSGFPFATRIQRNSGNTGTADVICLQAIETANCQDLAGSTVTVSFYARAGSNYSAASNNLLALVATGSATDQGVIEWIAQRWTNQLTATVGTAVLTTSWQRFSYSYTVPAGTTEIILAFNSPRVGTAGTNDYFDITGVQLEAGPSATEFELRPIGTELALCQRYYQKTYELGTAPATVTTVGAINYIAMGAYQDLNDRLMVEMRAAPGTVRIFNPATGTAGEVRNYSNSTNYAATINSGAGQTSSKQTMFRTTVPASSANELTYHLTVDAEL
jgi:hypothetical protein